VSARVYSPWRSCDNQPRRAGTPRQQWRAVSLIDYVKLVQSSSVRDRLASAAGLILWLRWPTLTDGSWAAHQNNWISCFDSKCLTARELKRERKCADTVGTVLVQKASGLAVSNAKNIFFKQNIRKQFHRTALGNCYALKLPKCWLQLKNKFVVLFIIMFGTLSFPGGIRELEFWTHAFQWQCSQRTNWLSTNRPSFAADNRLVTPMPNSHRQARPDKTVLSVSCLPRRCELYSRQLKTVAARKSEVWTR